MCCDDVFASQLWCVEDPGGVSNGGYRVISNRIGGKVTYYCKTVGTICLEMRRGLVRVMDPEPRGVDPLPSCQRELSVGVGGGKEACLHGWICFNIIGCDIG